MGKDRTSSVDQGPAELCGYAVVEALSPGACYLAIGPGGRGVALKRLDPDCLLGRLLHPDVRDRLARIRELAHTGVANLFGVGKEADEAWLIWEYVQGQPFSAYANERCRSPHELAALTRELVLTVESMHAQGIVHGAIQSGNVIVAPGGAVRLTHVSPLLYTDPADDADAIADMIDAALAECGQRDGALGALMSEARETKMPLRVLAPRLANLADAREAAAAAPGHVARRERGTRRRALIGALVIALAGGAVAYGVFAYGVFNSAGDGADPVRELLPTWLRGR